MAGRGQYPDIPHTRQFRAWRKASLKPFFQLPYLTLPAVFRKNVHGSARHSTGEGIAHKCGAVHKDSAIRANDLCHPLSAGSGGQRHNPAGQRLAHTHDIWRYTGPLTGKITSCAPKARGDFIQNQEAVMLAAQFGQPGKIEGVVKPHATRALNNWLQNYRGNLLSLALKGQSGSFKAV